MIGVIIGNSDGAETQLNSLNKTLVMMSRGVTQLFGFPPLEHIEMLNVESSPKVDCRLSRTEQR